MYTNLILYRNELKNKNIPKYKMVGMVVELIYSKIIFKQNQDIACFVKDVFNIEFKGYIMKSRSMIVARIGKLILKSGDNIEYKDKLFDFVNLQIEILKSNKDIKEKKNEFDGWVR